VKVPGAASATLRACEPNNQCTKLLPRRSILTQVPAKMVYHAKSNAAREVPDCWQVYDRCTGALASRPNRSRSDRNCDPLIVLRSGKVTCHMSHGVSRSGFRDICTVLLKHSLLTLHMIVSNLLYLGWLVYSIFCNPRMLLHENLSCVSHGK
jgi:hypothetical protein